MNIEHNFDTDWGRDSYLLFDPAGLLEAARTISFGGGWYGGNQVESLRALELGDESLVKKADEVMNKIEDQVPFSRGWRNIEDVVGAVPNIPAFLAGHPQCMRRRQRVSRDNAPIMIFMDLTSSGGIDSAAVQARGCTLLALARLLCEHRPVELWVGAALGQNRVSGTVAWRIDTAPLDLARAAHMIASTTMSRGIGYKLAQNRLRTHGHWPFDNYDRHVRTAPERLKRVFPNSEILYVPPIFITDELVSDPVGWIKRTLAKYIGETVVEEN